MRRILNKCPICGGKLEMGSLCQYTKYFDINDKGQIVKHAKRETDNGPIDTNFINCVNGDFLTDCEFDVIVPPHSNLYISQSKGTFYIKEEGDD